MTSGQQTVHGTLVAIGEKGLLLIGPSGAGKSDLALRLMSSGAPAQLGLAQPELVADDRVCIDVRAETAFGAAPAKLAGQLEVRNIGIITMPYKSEVAITAIIELDQQQDPPRLPPEPLPRHAINQVSLPKLRINPFENTAVEKLLLAARYIL